MRNPSVRKFKKLPCTCLGKVSIVTLEFAYHSKNNDYKVVRISSCYMSTETLHENDPAIQHPSFVVNFIESLVLLDGANMVVY